MGSFIIFLWILYPELVQLGNLYTTTALSLYSVLGVTPDAGTKMYFEWFPLIILGLVIWMCYKFATSGRVSRP